MRGHVLKKFRHSYPFYVVSQFSHNKILFLVKIIIRERGLYYNKKISQKKITIKLESDRVSESRKDQDALVCAACFKTSHAFLAEYGS